MFDIQQLGREFGVHAARHVSVDQPNHVEYWLGEHTVIVNRITGEICSAHEQLRSSEDCYSLLRLLLEIQKEYENVLIETELENLALCGLMDARSLNIFPMEYISSFGFRANNAVIEFYETHPEFHNRMDFNYYAPKETLTTENAVKLCTWHYTSYGTFDGGWLDNIIRSLMNSNEEIFETLIQSDDEDILIGMLEPRQHTWKYAPRLKRIMQKLDITPNNCARIWSMLIDREFKDEVNVLTGGMTEDDIQAWLEAISWVAWVGSGDSYLSSHYFTLMHIFVSRAREDEYSKNCVHAIAIATARKEDSDLEWSDVDWLIGEDNFVRLSQLMGWDDSIPSDWMLRMFTLTDELMRPSYLQ